MSTEIDKENPSKKKRLIIFGFIAIIIIVAGISSCNKTKQSPAVKVEPVATKTVEAPVEVPAKVEVDTKCDNPSIKGNVSTNGEKIYHVKGKQLYDKTDAEEMFCTTSEAEKAGYRASKR